MHLCFASTFMWQNTVVLFTGIQITFNYEWDLPKTNCHGHIWTFDVHRDVFGRLEYEKDRAAQTRWVGQFFATFCFRAWVKLQNTRKPLLQKFIGLVQIATCRCSFFTATYIAHFHYLPRIYAISSWSKCGNHTNPQIGLNLLLHKLTVSTTRLSLLLFSVSL